MEIEPIRYLSYPEAVAEHIELMRRLKEVRFGVFDRTLIESALARPQQAAAYEQADLPAQAATLCFGLIKNHLWIGGNKRTATHLTDHFLKRNGWEISATSAEVVEMVQAIESDQWDVIRLMEWMREHTIEFSTFRS
ncbi:MAG TPA: type II toxin-antitoxin system death-on-curing family toxin [Blastocatellia bacterium]|nr:type II toxin-antitoxin system death-on-curing family toxin [Blastocatellia bacterium]